VWKVSPVCYQRVQSGFWTTRPTCLAFGYTQGVAKSLARPGKKQARKHVRDARDFNNIETRAVIKFFLFLQGKAPKEIHTILMETLACFLPGRSKDVSAPLTSLNSVRAGLGQCQNISEKKNYTSSSEIFRLISYAIDSNFSPTVNFVSADLQLWRQTAIG